MAETIEFCMPLWAKILLTVLLVNMLLVVPITGWANRRKDSAFAQLVKKVVTKLFYVTAMISGAVGLVMVMYIIWTIC